MINKKILILGKGFIGEKLQKEFNCEISGSMINCFSDAENLVKKYNPRIIINCIGITGKRNVDDCELEKDTVLLANSFIPIMLAEVALRNNIKLVHISSGCIFKYDFKEDRPIGEKRVPDFLDLFYSRSKIYSERALEALADKKNILILRIRIPLDTKPHHKNILDKLIRCKKVIDVRNSVTYIPDFIKAVRHLIRINARGIFNVVNKGGLRYPKLMSVYAKYVQGFSYEVINFRELNSIRTNLILSTNKLEKTGFKVRQINSVLEECVKKYLKS